MELILVDYRDDVAVLKLNRGVTNAINLELLEQLAEHLKTIRDDPGLHSLVLSSANSKFFSIGFDIPHLFDPPKEDFRTFYHTFNQVCVTLYTLPKPTIAAITGHAIAGGCILALCCDYRLIGQGRKLMGLNEIKLGVPVPYPGDCILRHLTGMRNARHMLDTGTFYQPEQSLQMGIVDQVLPLEEVLPRAIEEARLLGAFPQKAFAAIKRNRVQPVESEITEGLAERENLFIELWYSPQARERLSEAISKF